MDKFIGQHVAFSASFLTLYFVVFWAGVGVLISVVGGWRSLAQRYRTERTFPDHKRWLQSGQMYRMVGYNNVLTVASDNEGIYLGVLFLFRIAHPPLFIPWSEIEIETPQQKFFVSVQKLRLGPDRIPLRLRTKLVEFLQSEKRATV
ncbi:MAG: hypothetical protein P4K80_07955 [Acidobacteriaceae bacterium]|nr:hypothetical protein [Acidobacteriaceae bacterium]